MSKQRSIEEQVEDHIKGLLTKHKTKYYTKTESINNEIDRALKDAPSKSGGDGGNSPDIKMFIESDSLLRYPVMIEVKGAKGLLTNSKNDISNKTKRGSVDYSTISKFAVNGAIHYGGIVAENTSFSQVIAVGANGYDDPAGNRVYEYAIYLISPENYFVPVLLSNDISLLCEKHWDKMIDLIKNSSLSEEEKEAIAKQYENVIEDNLRSLNQKMQDDSVPVGNRVVIVAGMIMAGLGVPGKVSPLTTADLKGQSGAKTHDGIIVINKVDDFLTEKNLPADKKNVIISHLQAVFVDNTLWEPKNGESKLKAIYSLLEASILPYVNPAKSTFLDFTGKLFNVLTSWIVIPDGGDNDVVLTPRYVTDMMAKLCQVNANSYVWDFAVGTAGFLVSSLKLMLQDSEKISDLNEKLEAQKRIRTEQLLGIEKRADIYLLAVLNMILMGDGSTNILLKDSLTYDGTYEQGKHQGEPFPATVFLLNPPYSAPGKGFIFVKEALKKMSRGKAAVLIQENAGAGTGLPYTKEILENNTLVASIHMSNIFNGKSNVQTAIYVFDVNNPHDKRQEVVFIDMSNDGYSRQNRKKAAASVNLKNTDDANGRYQEVVDIVLGRKKQTDYYKKDECVFIDTITLKGNDWTMQQHKKYDTTPTDIDFEKTVADYIGWKVVEEISEVDSYEGKNL